MCTLRWTAWLAPYLLDPNTSSASANRVAFALDKQNRNKRGAPSSLRDARMPLLRKLAAEGHSKAEMARRFGVNSSNYQ